MNYYANSSCAEPFLRTDQGSGTREKYSDNDNNKVPCISFFIDGNPDMEEDTLAVAKVTVYYVFKDRKA